MRRFPIATAALAMFALSLAQPDAVAQQFFIKPVAEKKVKELPAGPLYWRVENFATRAEAEAAAGPTSLTAEAADKVWLFTLGAQGGATPQDPGPYASRV